MSNTSSQPACSTVNARQQMRVNWTTASLSSIINSSSSSSSASASAAAAATGDNVDIRGSNVHRLSQYTSRSTCPAVSVNCLPQSINVVPAAAAVDAVRWKSPLAAYRPTPVFTHPAMTPSVRERYGDRAGYIMSSVVRPRDDRVPLCHVDPAVRGPCIACEYIRLNTQLRYEPYNRRRHGTETSHLVSYY